MTETNTQDTLKQDKLDAITARILHTKSLKVQNN